MSKSKKSLARLVDELGALKAQLATLGKREAELKAALIAAGQPVVEGILFDASISTADREVLDRAAVEAVLSPAQFAKCLKAVSVTSVRVVARANRAPTKRDLVRLGEAIAKEVA